MSIKWNDDVVADFAENGRRGRPTQPVLVFWDVL